MKYQDILNFWFANEHRALWFAQDVAFDEKINRLFLDIHQKAQRGELWHWRDQPEGRLAEILILDQFSRNLFRNQAAAFAQDTLALVLAQEAVRLKIDQQLPAEQRCFLYLPYMHSESALIHEQALILFKALGNPVNLDFEYQHKAIIDRFGRYPHRNAILGRLSTEQELAFLTQPNSSF